jgi:flagellar hook assembly protein FlgD
MIFDKFGNPVWETEIVDQSAGRAQTPWDGTDNDGNRVFSGVYIVCIKATNQTQTIALYTDKIAVIR